MYVDTLTAVLSETANIIWLTSESMICITAIIYVRNFRIQKKYTVEVRPVSSIFHFRSSLNQKEYGRLESHISCIHKEPDQGSQGGHRANICFSRHPTLKPNVNLNLTK